MKSKGLSLKAAGGCIWHKLPYKKIKINAVAIKISILNHSFIPAAISCNYQKIAV